MTIVASPRTAPSRYPPGPTSRVPLKLLIKFRRDVLGYLTEIHQAHGDIVHMKPLFEHFYTLSHPDHIREVLVTKETHFIKGPALRKAKDTLGNGLLISEGDFHKRQRRLSQPAFHAQRVNAYADTMTHYAVRMRDRWRPGETLDIHEQMMQYTLAVVAKTLFDADVESEVAEIGEAMHTSVRMFTRAMLPFGELLNYLPLPSNFKFLAARAKLFKVVGRFISQRRASGVDRGDLLSMLLRATDAEGDGRGMSDTQLRDECLTLFTAGHETSANALTFAWYLLGQHPAADAALHNELRQVLAGRLPTVEDLPNLPYTRAVIAEAMRLYPPAWALGREVKTDVEIGGYKLRRGSIVLMSQWVTHRDARWWPDPLKFDPSRWLNAAKTDRPRYAYFPFSSGVRSCIGESFAWLELILGLATFAQRWRVELVDSAPVALLPTITLRPRDGIRVTLRQR